MTSGTKGSNGLTKSNTRKLIVRGAWEEYVEDVVNFREWYWETLDVFATGSRDRGNQDQMGVGTRNYCHT